MSLTAELAARVGRYQLSRVPRTSADRTSSVDPSGANAALGFTAEAGLGVGKLSAGMLGGVVIGIGLFYIWTRSHQA